MPGIYRTWAECEAQVKGYKNADFKKLPDAHAALAFVQDIVQDTRPLVRQKPAPKARRQKKIPEPIPAPAPGTRLVWTDGACQNNGKPGAIAGVGVYFGDGDARNVSEPLEGAQTNQRAELKGAIRALEVLAADGDLRGPVQIRTDSRYVQKGLHEWLQGWKRRGWRTAGGDPVKNRELWEQLDALNARFADVTLVHVPGHSGIHGNEQADRLAVAGCEQAKVDQNAQ